MSVTNQLGAAVHANVELQLKLDAAVARVAALEGRTGELEEVLDEILDYRGGADSALEDRYVMERVRGVRDGSVSDGASVVSAAVAEERKRTATEIRARINAIEEGPVFALVPRSRVYAAIDATEGGAP